MTLFVKRYPRTRSGELEQSPSGSIMRQGHSLQCRLDQCPGVGIVDAGRSSKVHSAPPVLRSLGMNPGEDHPPASECSFDDCGCSVGILTDNRTPAGKLRAIFPVLIEHWSSGDCNRHRCLADTLTLGGVETELHPGGQIETVIVAGISSHKTASTDSEVVQPILHRVADVRGCVRSQAVTHVNEIPARNDQQTISPDL